MTSTTTYRISQINGDKSGIREVERMFRYATDADVNTIRQQMRSRIPAGSSDYIRVRAVGER